MPTSFDWLAIGSYIVILLVSITWHELAHALTAHYLGDDTPRRSGHLSLNPFRHMDQAGILILFVSVFMSGGRGGFTYGFTPVTERNLRPNARTGGGIVAIVGPLSNLLLAVILALPLRLGLFDQNAQVDLFARTALSVNVLLAVFNMLPLPPLDGWRVLATFLSSRTLYDWRNIVQYGPAILLFLFFFEPYLHFFGKVIYPLTGAITTALAPVAF